MFLTSHVLEIVERLCSDIAIIAQGKLLASGSLNELRKGIRVEGDGEGPVSLEEYFIHVVGGTRSSNEEEVLQWLRPESLLSRMDLRKVLACNPPSARISSAGLLTRLQSNHCPEFHSLQVSKIFYSFSYEVPVYGFECRSRNSVRRYPPDHATFGVHAVLNKEHCSDLLDCFMGESFTRAY